VIGEWVKIGNNASVFGATVAGEAMICPGAMLLEDPAPRAAPPGGDPEGTGGLDAPPVIAGLGGDHRRGAVSAPGVATGQPVMRSLVE
jgi:hypothetical protein